MKVLIIVALCIVAAMAVPIEESNVAAEEAPLTLVELEPASDESLEDALRVKRQYGG
jgi:hypothetical protein